MKTINTGKNITLKMPFFCSDYGEGLNLVFCKNNYTRILGVFLIGLFLLLGLREKEYQLGPIKYLEIYIFILAFVIIINILMKRLNFQIPKIYFNLLNIFILSILFSSYYTVLSGKTIEEKLLFVELARIIFIILLFWVTYTLVINFEFYKYLKVGVIISSFILNVMFLLNIIKGYSIIKLHLSFVDPNYYATFILILVSFLLTGILWKPGGIGFIVFSILMIILIIQLIMTVSRGGLISLIVIFLYAIIRLGKLKKWKKNLKLILTSFFLIMVIFIFFTFFIRNTPYGVSFQYWAMKKANLESGRWNLWASAFDLISNNFILGVGPAQARYYLGNVSHNIILEAMLAGGIFCAFSILALLFYTIIKLFIVNNKYCCSLKDISIRIGVETALIAIFLQSMSLNTMTLRHLWFLMGISAAIIRKSD